MWHVPSNQIDGIQKWIFVNFRILSETNLKDIYRWWQYTTICSPRGRRIWTDIDIILSSFFKHFVWCLFVCLFVGVFVCLLVCVVGCLFVCLFVSLVLIQFLFYVHRKLLLICCLRLYHIPYKRIDFKIAVLLVWLASWCGLEVCYSEWSWQYRARRQLVLAVFGWCHRKKTLGLPLAYTKSIQRIWYILM